ncbi:MFS general substrate transporter [Ceraceosorus guamensis]|uniref:MFS general substrate transporter n=1 Tax=Ceraceosorus guamensis TaxID=1522189 RepID=A0A316VV02_9BASI|nr:MFS general substrate transporter [Ceraceosorus guamensis]PWN40111.1 MFS general substrate transporter [Ceraceosorus guamensis]
MSASIEKEQPFASPAEYATLTRDGAQRTSQIDSKRSEDAASTSDDQSDLGSDKHIFSDPAVAAKWAAVYEESKYECRHRFDPHLTWDAEEERKLVRKLDIRIMLFIWVLFMSLDLIRRNINRALPDNFLNDLGITTDDFNNGQVIYFASFLFMELPSGLISKRLGADIWIPVQIVVWSIVCSAQAGLTNKVSFFLTRAFLGAAQGGFIPDACLYLSYFYTSAELTTRLSWFYTVLGISQILGSFLAAAFIELRGWHGLAGWQYLFAFEGLITGVVGIFAFFWMVPSVTASKGWLRGKNGWFNEREEKILVNRVLRDDATKGDMNNRQAVDWKGLWRALGEKDLWPIYLLGLVIYIPFQPPQTYLSLTLRNLGFSVLHSNLLAIPSQFLFAVNCLWLSWLARRYNERSLIAVFSNVWTLPLLIALRAIPHLKDSYWSWVRYALLTLVASFPYCHPTLISWLSQNSKSVRNRAVAVCLYNMSYQVGSIFATRIFAENDKPYYPKGFTALIVICAFAIVQAFATKAYYIWRNRSKQAEWAKLTADERIEYTLHNKEDGGRRLDVRLVH